MRGIFSSVEPHYGESRGTFQGEENHPGWNHRNAGKNRRTKKVIFVSKPKYELKHTSLWKKQEENNWN